MKIEYVMAAHIHDDVGLVEPHAVRAVPVVRLEQVDALIGEAVWAMEVVSNSIYQRMMWHAPKDPDYQRAQAFLASRDVAEWRERKEGK